MHKTGSTSIQQAFFKSAPRAGFGYLDLGTPNASTPLYLMFEDPERFKKNAIISANGNSHAENLEERDRLRAEMDRQIQDCPYDTMMISGESISGAGPNMSTDLASALRRHSDDIKVITYVRPPCSYMESAFQERLKRGMVEPAINQLWPNYERRFERLITGFHTENCHFIPFDQAHLAKGDIIADFAMRSGLPCPNGQQTKYNESLSTEATSLVFLYRKYIHPYAQTDPNSFVAEVRMIKWLSGIGKTKLRFDQDFLERAHSQFSTDWQYAQSLTGNALHETRDSSDTSISDARDLERIARSLLPQVQELMRSKGCKTYGDVTSCLHALFDRSHDNPQPVRQSTFKTVLSKSASIWSRPIVNRRQAGI